MPPSSSIPPSRIAPAGPDAEVHLVNPLWDPNGGADRRTVDLYKLLRRDGRSVRVWSEYRVDEAFARLGAQRIRPWNHPRRGTIVVVGVYFRTGRWIRRADARIVLIYNTWQPDRLAKTLRRIGDRPVDLVFTSEALRRMTLDEPRLAGIDRRLIEEAPVLESFVDPSSFGLAYARRRHAWRHGADHPFTVGRLSRDNPRKHHPDDPSVFAALSACRVRIRIMGGTSLADRIGTDPNVDLLPEGAIAAPEFLSSLDAFYYRTHPEYFEAFGRVVLEAMMCGVPVVVDRRGGYAQYVEHGVNGFLFDDPRDATDILLALRTDPSLAERVGRNARVSALHLFEDDLPVRTRKTLLGPRPVTEPARRPGVPDPLLRRAA